MTTTKQRITFVARSRELRTVMKPSFNQYDSRGDKIGVETGRAIQFVDSKYTTGDPEEIEFLRARMDAPDGPGIYELGVANAPSAEASLVHLIEISDDHEKVRKLLEEERSTYNRKPVVNACLKILGDDPDFAPAKVETPAPAPEGDTSTKAEASPDTHPSDMSMAELRAFAKAQGINTFQKSKAAILAELDGGGEE